MMSFKKQTTVPPVGALAAAGTPGAGPAVRLALVVPLLAGCAALMTGCSALGGGDPPPRTFDLVAPEIESIAGNSVRLGRNRYQLVVSEPVAVRALDGDRVMVKLGRSEVSYFGDVTWSDRLPKLVQARLIETLERSGRFRAVGNGRDKVAADLELATELIAFETAVESGNRQEHDRDHVAPAVAHVSLFAKLVDERRGVVVASRRFTATAPARKDSAVQSIDGMNMAFQSIAQQIAAWAAAVRFSRDDEPLRRSSVVAD